MTETNYCIIDYHTIINGTDVYACDSHDMAFSDPEGNLPILCDNCMEQKQMYWDDDIKPYLACIQCEDLR